MRREKTAILGTMLTLMLAALVGVSLRPSPRSATFATSLQQSASTAATTEKDCNINGSFKSLEDCPAETIIEQYKREYDVPLVLRGGVYWEVITGEYVNEQYGYKVALPDGIGALCSPPPMPWHGFFIDVAGELKPPANESENHGGFVWANWDVGLSVEAYYNVMSYKSVDEDARSTLKSLKKDAKDVIVLQWRYTRLQGMPAIHTVIQYTNPATHDTCVSDNIAALRREDGDGIMYELNLTTLASRYREDAKLFRQIRKSWKATRLGEDE